MLKKVLVGIGIVAVLTAAFLLGGITLGSTFGQTPSSVNHDAAEALVKGPDTDAVEEQVGNQTELDEQQPQYSGSIQVDEAQYEGMSEADEAAALQGSATISAAGAETAALAANPGASVIKTELDNENGSLVYGVELTVNCKAYDVKVDAGTGAVLYTEADELDGED